MDSAKNNNRAVLKDDANDTTQEVLLVSANITTLGVLTDSANKINNQTGLLHSANNTT